MFNFVAAALCTIAPLAGQERAREPGKGINFYSLEREIALGRQLAQEVQRQSKLLTDPILEEYINRIGQNVSRYSHAQVPFSFQVIQDDRLNAFALPGGFVF
jgi:predicted Zn-dependent protease